MYLHSVALQNFRNYSQSKFDFHPQTTVIIGPNTAGKTNLVEAVMLLATGKSFRAEKDNEIIRFDQEITWVQGKISSDDMKLEVMIAQGESTAGRLIKKYLVNGIAKSRNHFVGFLPAVLFRPEELDIIVDGPSLRRNFLDDVLEQSNREYRQAKITYEKALRQRNALLDLAKETGRRNEEQFMYWDELLISNGSVITKKREEFIDFINTSSKEIMDFTVTYDKSIMSEERLLQYKDAEIHAGVTLVGPQRDDILFFLSNKKNIQHFGSRGQQRLVILQLKMLQLQFLQSSLEKKPMLILDDIFSELDEQHIQLVMERIAGQQVIMTTTHKEFVNEKILKEFEMMELQ